jgi:hypothetical protein
LLLGTSTLFEVDGDEELESPVGFNALPIKPIAMNPAIAYPQAAPFCMDSLYTALKLLFRQESRATKLGVCPFWHRIPFEE